MENNIDFYKAVRNDTVPESYFNGDSAICDTKVTCKQQILLNQLHLICNLNIYTDSDKLCLAKHNGVGQIIVLPAELQVNDVLSVDNIPEPSNEEFVDYIQSMQNSDNYGNIGLFVSELEKMDNRYPYTLDSGNFSTNTTKSSKDIIPPGTCEDDVYVKEDGIKYNRFTVHCKHSKRTSQLKNITELANTVEKLTNEGLSRENFHYSTLALRAYRAKKNCEFERRKKQIQNFNYFELNHDNDEPVVPGTEVIPYPLMFKQINKDYDINMSSLANNQNTSDVSALTQLKRKAEITSADIHTTCQPSGNKKFASSNKCAKLPCTTSCNQPKLGDSLIKPKHCPPLQNAHVHKPAIKTSHTSSCRALPSKPHSNKPSTNTPCSQTPNHAPRSFISGPPPRAGFNGPPPFNTHPPPRMNTGPPPNFNGPPPPNFNGPRPLNFNGPPPPNFNGPLPQNFNGLHPPNFNGPPPQNFNGPPPPNYNGPHPPNFNGPPRSHFNGPPPQNFNGTPPQNFKGPPAQPHHFNGPPAPYYFNEPPPPHHFNAPPPPKNFNEPPPPQHYNGPSGNDSYNMVPQNIFPAINHGSNTYNAMAQQNTITPAPPVIAPSSTAHTSSSMLYNAHVPANNNAYDHNAIHNKLYPNGSIVPTHADLIPSDKSIDNHSYAFYDGKSLPEVQPNSSDNSPWAIAQRSLNKSNLEDKYVDKTNDINEMAQAETRLASIKPIILKKNKSIEPYEPYSNKIVQPNTSDNSTAGKNELDENVSYNILKKRLKISNLGRDITVQMLRRKFEFYGRVDDLDIFPDTSIVGKRLALITMHTEEASIIAKAGLQNSKLNGSRMIIEPALPQNAPRKTQLMKPADVAETKKKLSNEREPKFQIVIGNLFNDVKAMEIVELVTNYGKVMNCKIASKNGNIYAIVSLESEFIVNDVIRNLNKVDFNGKLLSIKKMKVK